MTFDTIEGQGHSKVAKSSIFKIYLRITQNCSLISEVFYPFYSRAFVCTLNQKTRRHRPCLVRTFGYLGFQPVKSGHALVPNRPEVMFLVYPIDGSSSDDE
uniref:Ornithine decarboxylase antizyme n=1 Tax=Eptatretus burgeri TaxID=7764 RepID=A0A8C4QXM1_EPTBU